MPWLPFTGFSLVELARFGAFYGLDAALTFPALVKLFARDLGQQAIGTMMSWMMMAHIFGVATTSAWVRFFGIAACTASFTLVGFVRISEE